MSHKHQHEPQPATEQSQREHEADEVQGYIWDDNGCIPPVFGTKYPWPPTPFPPTGGTPSRRPAPGILF